MFILFDTGDLGITKIGTWVLSMTINMNLEQLVLSGFLGPPPPPNNPFEPQKNNSYFPTKWLNRESI